MNLNTFKQLPYNTIFYYGIAKDSPEDLNLCNTGKLVRWVAVKGGIDDWAIYCMNPHYLETEDHWEWFKIAQLGDKIHSEETIKKLIKCDDELLKLYNH